MKKQIFTLVIECTFDTYFKSEKKLYYSFKENVKHMYITCIALQKFYKKDKLFVKI